MFRCKHQAHKTAASLRPGIRLLGGGSVCVEAGGDAFHYLVFDAPAAHSLHSLPKTPLQPPLGSQTTANDLWLTATLLHQAKAIPTKKNRIFLKSSL